ncbi:sigma-70 family RNA polymerase sigma factor [Streptomyces griseoviridis]|jgi:RNA polymerase sigma-70 factor (ECF subfamily)|uniref:DNA-directed RNA polymerase sigma-70 factor n=3 Tax=Streptomyces TaxID=1883 RepID=A0A918GR87_STRGD|nr:MULTISPECIES: sigma-70 family RNA polymerase sigma factor [Streptomyces]MDP9680336.1 RNA polymerase sigma-70 factor (ECF subfamily) [Streptomyces griseoviridis]GGS55352.1 DNA-directed RNA polymerase sigma-70 factor [Streptomyces niveoruber]GGT09316.1 DNA-directed RNA polymerase sigma-70 factor [Streptomyces griseoviridis]GGU52804.1 DNA-directed RNA polymerase sigma-70 factor [Streptomyces daghestanicus]GHI29146.1 DNA-directed RNA polymerase sigma-70 factor [Streptomyces daghestanicus]
MTTTSGRDRSQPPRRHQYLHTLVTQHRSALVSYAERLLTDRHLAEDIAQEALIRAWVHTDKLRSGEGSARGWLLKVTRNLVIDHTRSARVRHETTVDDTGEVAQHDHADAVLARVQADALLRSLPPEHREVLVHTYLYGYTVRETAQLLGVPAGTVKSRQHYALHALRGRAGVPPSDDPASQEVPARPPAP